MKRIFTLTFALLVFSIAWSQPYASLIGTVSDKSTKETILFATIVLSQGGNFVIETKTDIEGTYHIKNLDPGRYDLQVSYTGYQPFNIEDLELSAGVNEMDIDISQLAMLDGEIIVTDFDDAIAPSSSHAPEILKGKVAGVNIRGAREGSTMMPDGIRIRGLSSASISTSVASHESSSLPKSGQMTAGEWNDLHNWEDWNELLRNTDYSIMTERFEIYPTKRFSVFVTNKNGQVLSGKAVKLVSAESSVLWQTFTDNAGKAELWEGAFDKNEKAASIEVEGQKIYDIKTIDEGTNSITLRESCYSTQEADIAFIVDATSSMADEIHYLKSELLDVLNRIQENTNELDIRTGAVFYRDIKDEYLTRSSPFSKDFERTNKFIKNQHAQGGGDYPEAVDEALQKTLELDWRANALKVAFLILDAPPHEDNFTLNRIRRQIKEAASLGIRLVPITASGINRDTEFLMKFMAILTNGTYIFITDDSGIGEKHLDPVVNDYDIELLNECIERIVTQFIHPYSCETTLRNEKDLEVSVYPNPCTQYVNIKAESIPDKIKILSAGGMVIKTIDPSNKDTRIEMGDLVSGIYTIVSYFDNQKVSNRVIVVR